MLVETFFQLAERRDARSNVLFRHARSDVPLVRRARRCRFAGDAIGRTNIAAGRGNAPPSALNRSIGPGRLTGGKRRKEGMWGRRNMSKPPVQAAPAWAADSFGSCQSPSGSSSSPWLRRIDRMLRPLGQVRLTGLSTSKHQVFGGRPGAANQAARP
jgi:hypothetical protein